MPLTPKQIEANKLLASPARNIMLYGGARSGKTYIACRALAIRAMNAPGSRHAVLRYRFNHVKASVILDTFPKMMKNEFPGISYRLDKTDFYADLPGGSQIWFGGLDDKERAEKILGQEYVTVFLNECSQIPYGSVGIVESRLAQVVKKKDGRVLIPKLYCDCNPPNTSHWTYKLFVQKLEPATRKQLAKPDNYAFMRINPEDNRQNISDDYLERLRDAAPHLRKRFYEGEFAPDNPNGLFAQTGIDNNRVIDGRVPEMVRIVVAIDPSGSDGDNDIVERDAIGIVVVGLGTDGIAYLLEDITVNAGPDVWGRVACNAYERHNADVIVGEQNFGGAMVKFVVQTHNPRANYKVVTATRGKQVRAEPISALYHQNKVRHVGYYPELEDELGGFSTQGYIGASSPNRADALVWAITEIFSGIVKPRQKKLPKIQSFRPSVRGMGY